MTRWLFRLRPDTAFGVFLNVVIAPKQPVRDAEVDVYTPRLEIFPRRIRHNAAWLWDRSRGVDIIPVTKGIVAQHACVRAIASVFPTGMADARLENLRAIRATGYAGSLTLLRPAGIARARETVEVADRSLVGSIEVARALGQAAHDAGKIHEGILMVELGDLREGVMPEDALGIVRASLDVPGFHLVGLGTNFGCFAGATATVAALTYLGHLRDACAQETNRALPVLSGGSSSSLPLLFEGTLPEHVTELRVGEALLLGGHVTDRSPILGMRQDAFRVVGEVLEVTRKPSVPSGPRGEDAFGSHPVFSDRGPRLRAVINLGRQDIGDPFGLAPLEEGMEIIGASSDHLIVDVEERPHTYVGEQVGFRPSYRSLLALTPSSFVRQDVLEDG